MGHTPLKSNLFGVELGAHPHFEIQVERLLHLLCFCCFRNPNGGSRVSRVQGVPRFPAPGAIGSTQRLLCSRPFSGWGRTGSTDSESDDMWGQRAAARLFLHRGLAPHAQGHAQGRCGLSPQRKLGLAVFKHALCQSVMNVILSS